MAVAIVKAGMISPARSLGTSLGLLALLLTAHVGLAKEQPPRSSPSIPSSQPAAMPGSQPAASMPSSRPTAAPAAVASHRPTPPSAGPLQAVGWGDGEAITFAVKLAGIEAGRAAIVVGSPGSHNGQPSVVLRGVGETTPFIATFAKMREELSAVVALAGVLPLSARTDRTGPPKTRNVETFFGPIVRQTIRQDGATVHRARRIDGVVYDPLSALYAMRSMDLQRHKRLELRVLSGLVLFRVELEVRGVERVYSRLGPLDTIRIDGLGWRIQDTGKTIPARPPRRLSLWLTTDSRRVPVRLMGDTDIGALEATITSHVLPRSGLRVKVTGLAQPPFRARR